MSSIANPLPLVNPPSAIHTKKRPREPSDPLLHKKEAIQTVISPILAASADSGAWKKGKKPRFFTHWSIIEDLALLQAMRKLGRAWKLIIQETPELINRQPDSCRKRFDCIWAKQISLAELQNSEGEIVIKGNGRSRRLVILNSKERSDSCNGESPLPHFVEPWPLQSPLSLPPIETKINNEEVGDLNLFDPVEFSIDTSDPLYQQILESLI
ncbi:SANT/Myb-like DNA-binding domain-containing protein [Candidatus Protochlamydia phocaeensis]|uniref:SANT/Myb-like DNA-binding domain-containing protein n=1 Tax=Candidatus Protochlamydia phocaeensis TaxID=1414722 RepID=UPI0008382DCD|nr:SANT/Myb-like DNA-binding domain-containing protein [Candidatus Protochlamydia phocaeensis]